jgi:hypothetical protein
MDDENAQTHVSNRGTAAQGTGRQAGNHGSGGKKKGRETKIIAIVAAVVMLLALIAFGLWNVYRTTTAAQLDGSRYQAVFLVNGQTYFGKLQNLNSSYMKLTDVFYLQTREAENRDSANPQETSNQADLQLIKLGNEIHGPEDEMIISKDQILFFENLKTEGRVTQSINEYHSGQGRQ